MYTLYRVTRNGQKMLVGYYDNPAEAGCAIDEDSKKFDDGAVYEMERERDERITGKANP